MKVHLSYVSFQKVLPFPYLICFLELKGVWELDVPLVVYPFRWFICLLGHDVIWNDLTLDAFFV